MKIGPGVSELWRVENRPLPLTWPMAYTTACTTVQAVIRRATFKLIVVAGPKKVRRNSPRGSVLNKLIKIFLVTSPHSMLSERAVKCHTLLKTDPRSSMSRKSVNSRMCIALNSSGTANFNPRPAVARFLTVTDRRNRNPEFGRYANREFVKKFFPTDNVV